MCCLRVSTKKGRQRLLRGKGERGGERSRRSRQTTKHKGKSAVPPLSAVTSRKNKRKEGTTEEENSLLGGDLSAPPPPCCSETACLSRCCIHPVSGTHTHKHTATGTQLFITSCSRRKVPTSIIFFGAFVLTDQHTDEVREVCPAILAASSTSAVDILMKKGRMVVVVGVGVKGKAELTSRAHTHEQTTVVSIEIYKDTGFMETRKRKRQYSGTQIMMSTLLKSQQKVEETHQAFRGNVHRGAFRRPRRSHRCAKTPWRGQSAANVITSCTNSRFSAVPKRIPSLPHSTS